MKYSGLQIGDVDFAGWKGGNQEIYMDWQKD